MIKHKYDQTPSEKNEIEGKVWPPAPTLEQPEFPQQNNSWKMGMASLTIALPAFLCSSLDLLQSRGYVEQIFGRSIKFNEIDGSGPWLVFYLAGTILGLASWQSWQGKLGIIFSLITIVSGVLFPTFH